jgi:hypothetical protein
VKYRALTRARGRCECCGAHEHQRALEVDHIIPRNQGGCDDLSNLQALCFRGNAGKRDTDRTDLRGLQASYASRKARCVFCALERSRRVLLENELALCIADAYLCFLTRSFSDQQPLEGLLRREATESHVAPVVVIDPQIAG